MYIKNQKFSDEDTLFETLFDFEIGTASPFMQEIVDSITNDMQADEALTTHLNTMEEEDRLELFDDIRRERTVKTLQQQFNSYSVSNPDFFAHNGEGATLLYTVDMY